MLGNVGAMGDKGQDEFVFATARCAGELKCGECSIAVVSIEAGPSDISVADVVGDQIVHLDVVVSKMYNPLRKEGPFYRKHQQQGCGAMKGQLDVGCFVI